jgi:hypothetical protein
LGTSPVTAVYRNGVGAFPDWLASLFSGGAPGVLLDPSTAGTLYQTTAMTTPSLPGDPVGAMLDKSKWGGVSLNAAGATTADKLAPILGPELVVNGGFDTDTDWTKGVGWTISDGKARWAGGTDAFFTQNKTLAVGQYLLEFTLEGITSGGVAVRNPNNASSNAKIFYNDGRHFVALEVTSAAGNSINFRSVSLNAGTTIDNVSVREIPGNHATQATAAKRPTYGIHPFGGRRNLLTQTENFADAVWGKLRVTATANTTTAPDGTLTADTMQTISGTSGGEQAIRQSRTLSDASCFSIYVKKSNWRYVGIRVFNYSIFDFDTETWTLTGAGETVFAENVGNGWYRISSASASTGSSNIGVSLHPTATANSWGAAIDGTQLFVWGAQLELGATATAYQKVTTQYEVTESGVPSVHCLSFDGVDDALATPSIDFTATDEMTVFAGVRKLSDAAVGIVVELSADVNANSGVFSQYVQTTGRYGTISRGTISAAAQEASNTSNVPSSDVLSVISDISGDAATLRNDGSVTASSVADQGAGNFGNYPLYIGARAGTSLYFNGHLYGLTVRGALTDDAVVQAVEAVMATKTGVTL